MEIPPLLYHGTTREFHDAQIESYGKYMGNLGVHLGVNSGSPMGYAVGRSRKYFATPLLLVVDSSKVERIRIAYPFECSELEGGSYEELDIELRRGKISEETLRKLGRLEEDMLKRLEISKNT